MELVVKVNVFIADMKDFSEMNSVYEQYFGEEKPCRTYECVSLLLPDLLTDLLADAWRPRLFH